MSLFQRVIRSIVCHRQKTILLLLIFFIIGNAIAVAVAVGIGTKNVEKHIKQRLGAVVQLGLDHAAGKKIMEEQNKRHHIIDDEQVSVTGNSGKLYTLYESANEELEDRLNHVRAYTKEMAASNLVKSYDFNIVADAGSSDLVMAGQDLLPPESRRKNENYFGISLYGTDYPPLQMLEGGGAVLVEGRSFTQEEVDDGHNVALIGQELAELNGIKVGDRLNVTHYPSLQSIPDLIAGEIELSFEIIGIYRETELPQLRSGINHTNSSDVMDEVWRKIIRLNTLWVPNQVLLELAAQSKSMVVAKGVPEKLLGWGTFYLNLPTFVLHSPDDVEPFIREFSPLFTEGLKLFANHSIYDQIKQPLQQTQKMARSVLLFSVAVAIVIIGLTVLLFIRDRKYELGILMALGERKRMIVGQIGLEVLLIAGLGVVLSLFSGQFLANQISDAMIQDQLIADIDLATNDDYWAARIELGPFVSDLSPQDVADNYQITFSPKYIVIFLAIYLGTSLLATTIPTYYIVQLQPKRVLMAD